jgi:hypothetical protein
MAKWAILAVLLITAQNKRTLMGLLHQRSITTKLSTVNNAEMLLPEAHKSVEYLTGCHYVGVSGNRFATHRRGVNVRGIN